MSDWEPARELEAVTVLRREGAAKVLLSRPEALNAWNDQLVGELRDCVEELAADDGVRALLLTGAGRAFSSGADLKDLSGGRTSEDGSVDVGGALRERYHPIIRGLREMPKPVVTAVNGPAVGIGCSLALAGDLVVAAESAYLLLAFVNIGLAPDGGSSLFVPSRAGMARAAEMAMLGERIPAARALEWGLVNRVVPDDELEAAAGALVDRLAAGPTRSYAAVKRQLNHWLYARMEEQLELEADLQQQMAGTQDFVEGATAFLQKRAPRFQGR